MVEGVLSGELSSAAHIGFCDQYVLSFSQSSLNPIALSARACRAS
jgi:hypothetical protein